LKLGFFIALKMIAVVRMYLAAEA